MSSDDLNAKAMPWVPSYQRSQSSQQAEERALEEIERELDQLGYDDADAMDHMEEEMKTGGNGKVLPMGAMPIGQDGALSPLAAEFWFPECRDCTCCKGFKYGCTCRGTGAVQCHDASCGGFAQHTVQSQTQNEQSEEVDDTQEEYDEDEDEVAMALMEEELSREASKKQSAPSASSKAYVPAGAMPIGKDGALSPLAAEFWFPECRDCTCCKGFKYGCTCRGTGAIECQDASCAALTSPAPSAPKTSSIPSTSAPVSTPSSAPATRGPSTPDQPCSFFLAGSCRFGESCRFKHSAVGAAGANPSAVGGKPAEKDMCRYDTRCAYRSTGCTYRHTPCTHFFRSSCAAGNDCIFSHNPLDNA